MKDPAMTQPSVVLVTGGAGYIGSHVVLALRDLGIAAVVADDLSTGQRALVPAGVPLEVGDIGDRAFVAGIIERHGVTAVMHFAGSIVVPESVEKPLAYYRNNVVNSLALIETAVAAGIRSMVFSSTAAVYGIPQALPVGEDAPMRPINPYDTTKLVVEQVLRDVEAAHGLRHVILRHFNVAGADPAGRSGQCSPVATHLIKIACEAATGRRPEVAVFGDDYPTPDGTCVRDYIHVADLAAAHVRALRHLEAGGGSLTLNCGYGEGHSVREVLRAVERAAGRPLAVRTAGRRAGDPPALVAGAARIAEALGWRPKHQDLDVIVRTALEWERHKAAQR
jgi:UDP-glucose 4-epimerase